MANNIIWVLVSTTNKKEAEKMGMAILKQRLCACFGLYPKIKSVYFWPPSSGKFEHSLGPLLVLETFPKNYAKITSAIKKLHSDQVPFIGKINVEGLTKEFFNWMKGELK